MTACVVTAVNQSGSNPWSKHRSYKCFHLMCSCHDEENSWRPGLCTVVETNPFDLSRLMCHSAGVCCGWRESDEKAARGECDGASHGQKGSVHLHWVSVDQRIGNTQQQSNGNTRSNTQYTTVWCLMKSLCVALSTQTHDLSVSSSTYWSFKSLLIMIMIILFLFLFWQQAQIGVAHVSTATQLEVGGRL